MNVISIDSIVKNILLKRKYPFHYYIEFLVYCTQGLKEIGFDDGIQTIRYKLLPVDSSNGNVITIPPDYLDYCRVSVRIGQYLHPLVEDNALDLVPNYDANFVIQPYSSGIASLPSAGQSLYDGYLSPYWWMANYDAFGENLGRQYGGIGTMIDTFKVNKARNEIKINEALSIPEAVLEYISNGMDADSATHIDGYAQFAIESFAMWQFKENNRTYSQGEAQMAKQEYANQRQILRARLSDLNIDKLKRIVQKNAIRIKY